MFYELICLLFAFLNIMVCASSSYADFIVTKSELAQNHIPKAIAPNSLLLQRLYKAPSAPRQIHGHTGRTKRGIVLIDEDFNVPPEPGIKQSWSDGSFDRNEVDTKNATTIFPGEQGSGSSETMGEPILTKSSRFVTPGNLEMTSILDHKSMQKVDYTELEGSADDPFKYANETTLKVPDTTTSFVHVSTSAETSKDDMTESISPSTHTPTSTEIPSKHIDDSNVRLCLNFTCNSKDLIILPSLAETVPEGTNLTFFCAQSNVTEKGLLRWYKFNESDHSIMEESNNGSEISLDILQTSHYHADDYMCVRFTELSCCHRKLDITVYEMISYKQHFIIIGGIAAASLLVCILLGVHKSVKTKKYEEAVQKQTLEKPFLL